jgi:hypothetical protein
LVPARATVMIASSTDQGLSRVARDDRGEDQELITPRPL